MLHRRRFLRAAKLRLLACIVQVISFLIPVSLLAVDFYFWAWIWDASVGPASGTHVRWRSNGANRADYAVIWKALSGSSRQAAGMLPGAHLFIDLRRQLIERVEQISSTSRLGLRRRYELANARFGQP